MRQKIPFIYEPKEIKLKSKVHVEIYNDWDDFLEARGYYGQPGLLNVSHIYRHVVLNLTANKSRIKIVKRYQDAKENASDFYEAFDRFLTKIT